ncbi:MAG: cytochrome b/b6 domain-containing protein [Candidatus Andeanibacterium colombiense]|uniref:Cytochrome b/b6 domain-containing protein n=1 Tax=Candidatus Andeanibacterium colombiense TaxID=3121345 RepID=A0AAJ5X539_9SPHN|nr:MAG: cytochrome b/b6 domain-containing protein [Sphingomonadaceae bacterium]
MPLANAAVRDSLLRCNMEVRVAGASAGEALEPESGGRHRPWVRLTHWIIAFAVLALIYSGVAILMVHPKLYWGNGGNDLIPPLFEVPIGPNYHQGSWAPSVPFFASPGSPVTADRLVEPWNENGWARSMHFLAAWFFLIGMLAYWLLGLVTGHLRRNLLPRRAELGRHNIWADVKAHLRVPMPAAKVGPPYAILQKLAYALVVLALPLMFLTGITMSPAITADYPVLLDIFGGAQSARTIHFFTFAFLALFLLVHLAMILLTGPLRQLRAMTFGGAK